MSIFDQLLSHTYTRTPVTASTADTWGINAESSGNAVSNQVCFFNPSEALRINEAGQVTIRGPVLLVAANSVLNVGDQVSNVASGGSTLEAGPLTVDVIDALTLTDAVEIKRARLRRALSSAS